MLTTTSTHLRNPMQVPENNLNRLFSFFPRHDSSIANKGSVPLFFISIIARLTRIYYHRHYPTSCRDQSSKISYRQSAIRPSMKHQCLRGIFYFNYRCSVLFIFFALSSLPVRFACRCNVETIVILTL